MSAEPRLAVSEIFGPTFQGEGASLGRRCAFLRLAGCNLACSWCDTPYTWDWTGANGHAYNPRAEVTLCEPAVVLGALVARDTDAVVISGGEPMLQARQLVPLVTWLHDYGIWVEMETNGTRPPPPALAAVVDRFTVSLKLDSSGNPAGRALNPVAIQAFVAGRRAVWKFVAVSTDDLEPIGALVSRYGLEPVYVMPEGRTPEAVLEGLRTLAGPVLERGWNLTPRLHVLLWGDERAR